MGLQDRVASAFQLPLAKIKRIKNMKINELLTEYKKESRHGVIDLGFQNGWGQDTWDLHEKLMAKMVNGTFYKTGSPSWQRFSFVVSDGEEEYKVIYSLDSGD